MRCAAARNKKPPTQGVAEPSLKADRNCLTDREQPVVTLGSINNVVPVDLVELLAIRRMNKEYRIGLIDAERGRILGSAHLKS